MKLSTYILSIWLISFYICFDVFANTPIKNQGNIKDQVKIESDLNPILYFPLNGNANDFSGNGIHGIAQGAVPSDDWRNNSGQAYLFDGLDDYIAISTNKKFQITGDLSFSVWIKPFTFEGISRGIINCSKDNTDNPGTNKLYGISFNNHNYLTYAHEYDEGINQVYELDGFAFEADRWSHIVVLRDSEERKVVLFVDTIPVDSLIYDENPDNGEFASLRIGENHNTIKNPRYFDGTIDEFYLFDRTLSKDEILSLYESNTKMSGPTNLIIEHSETNLVRLNWQDNSKIEDGYEIERKTSNSEYKPIALVASNVINYEDLDISVDTDYCYRVRAFKDVQLSAYSDYSNEVCNYLTTVYQSSHELKNNFILYPNYPNPFNPSTKISYEIPATVKGEWAIVNLVVYDILGREVATLVNQTQKPGNYSVEFYGADLTNGIYYYKLSADQYSVTRKMLLVK